MAIIGSLPYILVNGTTADATQVMADFNFIIGQTNANALPLTGPGTITGSLTVTGPISANGGLTTTLQDGVSISAASGQTARYQSQSAGHDQWEFGSDASGNFTIYDNATALLAVSITPIGGLTFVNSVAVLAPAGQNAVYWSNVTGQRQWNIGQHSDSTYRITDQTAGADRVLIDTTGNTTIYNNLTVGGAIIGNSTVASQTTDGVSIFAASGQTARYRSTVASVCEWDFGCIADGTFQFLDKTSSVTRMLLDRSSVLNVFGGLIAGGNGIAYSAYAPNKVALKWSGSALIAYIDNANVGTIAFTSDERIKRNIAALEGDPLSEVSQLRLISFDMPDRIGDTPARHVRIGFSANQVEQIMPDAVLKDAEHAIDPERDLAADPLRDDEMIRSIDPLPLLARCVGAIQQLTARVAALEAQLAAGR